MSKSLIRRVGASATGPISWSVWQYEGFQQSKKNNIIWLFAVSSGNDKRRNHLPSYCLSCRRGLSNGRGESIVSGIRGASSHQLVYQNPGLLTQISEEPIISSVLPWETGDNRSFGIKRIVNKPPFSQHHLDRVGSVFKGFFAILFDNYRSKIGKELIFVKTFLLSWDNPTD